MAKNTFRYDGHTYQRTDSTEWARGLGAEAHDRGQVRFPGGDTALMAKAGGFSAESSAMMAAWLMGYDARVTAGLMSV